MSIYATMAEIGIKRFGDKEFVDILAQGVPPHIDYVGEPWEFLPPPVDPNGETMRVGPRSSGKARTARAPAAPVP